MRTSIASIKMADSFKTERRKVKPKKYPFEQVEKLAKTLAEAPALTPRFIQHEDTLEELSKQIRDLHFKKNYEAKQIALLLKENGIKTTIKEIKNLLENGSNI